MSKRIIKIEGCNDCPFRNDYPDSDSHYYPGTPDVNHPTCNIGDNKEIDMDKEKTYRPDWCEFSKWDYIEIKK